MVTTSNRMFKGHTIQLLPFNSKYWECVARWFYQDEYKGFFRQFTKMLNEEDFKQYPRVVMGEVFIIHSLTTEVPIGMIQCIPDCKKNKAGHLGLLVDCEAQGKHIPTEAMILTMDYLFNRQGYNKVVLEILESNESLKNTLDKSGWYREGKLLQECFIDGRFQNELRYCMTAKYFNKNKDQAMKEYIQWADSLKV